MKVLNFMFPEKMSSCVRYAHIGHTEKMHYCLTFLKSMQNEYELLLSNEASKIIVLKFMRYLAW